METNEAAKRALIAYRQLEAILQNRIVSLVGTQHVANSYDRILETLKQCFSTDPDFGDAVKHLNTPPRGDNHRLATQIESDGKVLLATAHTFIELHLSPEDKKNAIGFTA